MGSRGTFVLQRLGSVAFKLFAAIDFYSVNCQLVSKSDLIETGPTVPVAMALMQGVVTYQANKRMAFFLGVDQEISRYQPINPFSDIKKAWQCSCPLNSCKIKHSRALEGNNKDDFH